MSRAFGRQPHLRGGRGYDVATVSGPKVPRSKFPIVHQTRNTGYAGLLYPLYCIETLPGDTFSGHIKVFLRLNWQLFPVMDNAYVDWQIWSVPDRLVWDNFSKFLGAQENPDDSIDFLVPEMGHAVEPDVIPKYPIGKEPDAWDQNESFSVLMDAFGLPTGVDGLHEVIYEPDVFSFSCLPFRKYNLIWNDWYRDENLQNSVTVLRNEGPDPSQAYHMLRRGRRKDYVFGALPWPQKGDAVQLPIGLTAPVIGDGKTLGLTNGIDDYGLVTNNFRNAAGDGQSVGFSKATAAYGEPVGELDTWNQTGDTFLFTFGVTDDPNNSGLVADLSGATAITVSALRMAVALQHYLERDARGGTRDVEWYDQKFGIQVGDIRLQRPEFIGSGHVVISQDAVPQTTPSSGEDSQGSQAGVAMTLGHSRFRKSFIEYGHLIVLLSVRTDQSLQERVDRMWRRRTRYDYVVPDLNFLSEQAILAHEVYYQYQTGGGPIEDPLNVFGYQDRWAEHRTGNTNTCGYFRSVTNTGFDAWHYALAQSASPFLNDSFVEERPQLKRTLAQQDEPHFWFWSRMELSAVRPIPMYSTPGLRRL